jgi:hypothetical protein
LIEADHHCCLRFGKGDKQPALLQVNRESRSLALPTYQLFDSEFLFNGPKYFNDAKDTLHLTGDWIYCMQKPWLSNTSDLLEDFKKIRHLTMSNGMTYFYL